MSAAAERLERLHSQDLACLEDPDGKVWLTGIAKRSYAFDGRVEVADVQDPVLDLPEMELDGAGALRKLLDETDLVTAKVATDVVVRGTVQLPAPARRHAFAVAVGESCRRLELLGPRRADVSLRGEVRLSEPSPFEALELDLEQAYGGHDAYAQRAFDGGAVWLPSPEPRELGPAGVFAYPRNPIGRGYVIDLDRRRADGMHLPRIEDPSDRLSAGRFFRPRPRAWLDAPIPGHVGWVPHHVFPRCDRLTGPIVPRNPPERPLAEARFADGKDLPHDGGFAPRALQGAAPGLAVERLRGDEIVILQGAFPEHPELRFRLPGERPEMTLHVPDLSAAEVRPSLQTLRIDLDRRVFSLTWTGAIRLAARIPHSELRRCALTVRWRRS